MELPVELLIDGGGSVCRDGPGFAIPWRPDADLHPPSLRSAENLVALLIILRLILQRERIAAHHLLEFARRHAMTFQVPRVPRVPIEIDAAHRFHYIVTVYTLSTVVLRAAVPTRGLPPAQFPRAQERAWLRAIETEAVPGSLDARGPM